MSVHLRLFLFFYYLSRFECFVIDDEGQDLTEVASAVGEDVVDATLQKVGYYLERERKPVFLKRIALVESSFGQNQDVMSSNPAGGIWQISPSIYNAIVKANSSSNVSSALLDKIQSVFHFECFLCSYNFSSPLKSVLACILFIEIHSGPGNKSSVTDQAVWWSTIYNNKKNSTKFADESLKFDIAKSCENESQINLILLLDGSFRVRDDEFKSELQFVTNLAQNFNLSFPNFKLRLASYSLEKVIYFNLNRSSEMSELQNFTLSTRRSQDEIQTGKALFNVLDDGFSSLAGARHNIPRVLFVITNGRSSDDILKPVKIIKEAEIMIFVIAIGNKTNKSQLQEMAFDNNHLHEFESFDELSISSNIKRIREQLCRTIFAQKISKFIVEEMHLSKHSYSSARDLDDSIKKVFKLRCFNCGDSTSRQVFSTLEDVFTRNNKVVSEQQELLLMQQIIAWSKNPKHYRACQNVNQFDIWFLMNGVATYTDDDFRQVTSFVFNLTDHFVISRYFVQVGISCFYQDKHHIFLEFSQSNSKNALIETLNGASNPTKKNYYGKALQKVLDENFEDDALENSTSRNNIGKYLILVTSGKSGGILNSAELKPLSDNIQVLTVGVGEGVNMTELEFLVPQPKKNYAYKIHKFDELPPLNRYMLATIRRSMYEFYCNKIMPLTKNQDTKIKIGKNEKKTVFLSLQPTDVLVLSIESPTSLRNASGYLSTINMKPNIDFYDMAILLNEKNEQLVLDGGLIASRYPSVSSRRRGRTDNNTKDFPIYLTIISRTKSSAELRVLATLLKNVSDRFNLSNLTGNARFPFPSFPKSASSSINGSNNIQFSSSTGDSSSNSGSSSGSSSNSGSSSGSSSNSGSNSEVISIDSSNTNEDDIAATAATNITSTTSLESSTLITTNRISSDTETTSAETSNTNVTTLDTTNLDKATVDETSHTTIDEVITTNTIYPYTTNSTNTFILAEVSGTGNANAAAATERNQVSTTIMQTNNTSVSSDSAGQAEQRTAGMLLMWVIVGLILAASLITLIILIFAYVKRKKRRRIAPADDPPSPKPTDGQTSPKPLDDQPSLKSVDNQPSPKSVDNQPPPKSYDNQPPLKSVKNQPPPKSFDGQPSTKPLPKDSDTIQLPLEKLSNPHPPEKILSEKIDLEKALAALNEQFPVRSYELPKPKNKLFLNSSTSLEIVNNIQTSKKANKKRPKKATSLSEVANISEISSSRRNKKSRNETDSPIITNSDQLNNSSDTSLKSKKRSKSLKKIPEWDKREDPPVAMQQEAATNSFSSENSVKKSSNNMDENLEATNTVKCSQSPENVKKQNLIQSFEGNEDEQRLDSKAVNQKHSPKPTNWMVVKNSLKELSKLVDADEVEADKKDDASKLEEHIVGNKDDMPFRELPRKEESLPRFLTDGMTVEQQIENAEESSVEEDTVLLRKHASLIDSILEASLDEEFENDENDSLLDTNSQESQSVQDFREAAADQKSQDTSVYDPQKNNLTAAKWQPLSVPSMESVPTIVITRSTDDYFRPEASDLRARRSDDSGSSRSGSEGRPKDTLKVQYRKSRRRRNRAKHKVVSPPQHKKETTIAEKTKKSSDEEKDHTDGSDTLSLDGYYTSTKDSVSEKPKIQNEVTGEVPHEHPARVVQSQKIHINKPHFLPKLENVNKKNEELEVYEKHDTKTNSSQSSSSDNSDERQKTNSTSSDEKNRERRTKKRQERTKKSLDYDRKLKFIDPTPDSTKKPRPPSSQQRKTEPNMELPKIFSNSDVQTKPHGSAPELGILKPTKIESDENETKSSSNIPAFLNKYQDYSGEELKKKLKLLIKMKAESDDLSEVIAALETFYADQMDDPTKNVIIKAKIKLLELRKERLLTKLKHALGLRDHGKITSSLTEINQFIGDGLDQDIIDSDHELTANMDKAKKVAALFDKIEKWRQKIMELRMNHLEKICEYTKPPTEVRNVMEAAFILLGEDQEKLISWKILQSLIRKSGNDGVQQRIMQLRNETVTKYDVQKVQDLLSDLSFEDVRDTNKVAAAFYQWVSIPPITHYNKNYTDIGWLLDLMTSRSFAASQSQIDIHAVLAEVEDRLTLR